jgi:hypothetical protein
VIARLTATIRPPYTVAYGDAANLAWLVHEHGIEPHIPVFEKGRRDGSFGRNAFRYDHDSDSYTCPSGKPLRRFWQEGRAAKAKPPVDGIERYRARKADCDACALRAIAVGRCWPQGAALNPRRCA